MRKQISPRTVTASLLGIAIGAGGVWGGQNLWKDHGKKEDIEEVMPTQNFDKIPEDPSAPYVITPSGEKYHDPGCAHIAHSRKKHVDEETAKNAKYTPCSSCLQNSDY